MKVSQCIQPYIQIWWKIVSSLVIFQTWELYETWECVHREEPANTKRKLIFFFIGLFSSHGYFTCLGNLILRNWFENKFFANSCTKSSWSFIFLKASHENEILILLPKCKFLPFLAVCFPLSFQKILRNVSKTFLCSEILAKRDFFPRIRREFFRLFSVANFQRIYYRQRLYTFFWWEEEDMWKRMFHNPHFWIHLWKFF